MDYFNPINATFHLLDRIPVGMGVLSDDFTVLWWNRQLATWTGIDQTEIKGMAIDAHIPQLHQLDRAQWAAVFTEGTDIILPAPLCLASPSIDYQLQCTTITAIRGELDGQWWALLTFERLALPTPVPDETAQRYALALTAAQVGVWDWNLLTNTLFVDANLKAMVGYTETEIGSDLEEWAAFTHPEDRAIVVNAIEAHLQGDTPHFKIEQRMRHRDGHYFWVLSQGRAMRDHQGNPIRLVGVDTNIDLLYQTQQALIESETRLYDLAASVPGMLHQLSMQADGALEFTYISSGYREIFELDLETGDGGVEDWLDLIDVDDRLQLVEALVHSARSLHPCNWEGRLILPSGQVKWLQLSSRPQQNTDQTITWSGILLDVTRRRAVEDALRQSQGKLNSILSSLEDVVWSVSADTGEVLYFSPNPERLYGYSVAEFYQNPNLWLEVVHPGDRERVTTASQQLLTAGSQDLEYRITRATGEIRWVRDRSRLIQDSAGNPIRIDTIVTDITKRKQTEAALWDSEELLRAIIDTVPAMVSAKDTRQRYMLMNAYQAQLYGVSTTDAVGKTAADLLGAAYGRYTSQVDQTVFATEEAIPFFEEEYADAHGISHTWLTTKVPLKNVEGEVRGLVTVAVDITARKRAEAALERHLQRTLLLKQITEEIRQSLDSQQVFQTTVVQTGLAFRANRCLIHLYTTHPIPQIPIVAQYADSGMLLSNQGEYSCSGQPPR
ncbi:MAG: PAS domain-containing protein [Leptolyngbyaceae cyanobacterium SL_7_1]|nr:PAS domain-containing protein [Leptolyngbyaceae cyanobacterium SL_7_1]